MPLGTSSKDDGAETFLSDSHLKFLGWWRYDDNDDVSTIFQYKFEAVCLSDFKAVFFCIKAIFFNHKSSLMEICAVVSRIISSRL